MDGLWAEAAPVLSGAALAVIGGRVAAWETGRQRKVALKDSAVRYEEPLLHAAHNLQSRLYNILEQDFLGIFLDGGTKREEQYAKLNTAFLIGQYLCWAEMIRYEGQFLASSRKKHQRAVIASMEEVRFVFADSRGDGRDDPTLRIFRGDQRGIGELFLARRPDGSDDARYRCLGYADFVERYRTDERFESWIEPLVHGVEALSRNGREARERIAAVQVLLVELVELIDPDGRRVGMKDRGRATQSP